MTAFAIASLLLDGEVVPAVIRDELVYDIRTALPAVARTADLFGDWDRNLDLLADHLDRGAAPAGGIETLLADRRGRMLPPVQPVGPVIAAGANYREHIIQMSVAHGLGSDGASPQQLRAEAAAEMDERIRTGDPYIWTGLASAVSGARDDVVLPDVGHDVDWEIELGVYLGRTAHRVGADDALRHVAGYTIVNDLTVRSLVPRNDMAKIGTDWFRAKNQPGFFPTGPWLVPARFVPDPGALAMRLRLNGEVMQDSSSADLAFDVPALISYASSVAVLQPGDLLITGSPAGNGSHWGRFLTDGDVMDAEIEGLGAQRTVVRGASGELPPWQASR
ncbi:fumarylacetoacetate hydrolase family protein [Microbacterium ureisolvens]|uniref:Fumarylacetoacetate hydrolase family protein n=1 Tax=Microbacterium ureisolvens TaxID=2781186 RepID=A0ABS7HZ11_9MICO|nr:fumarylacetoacetate hydrolase family protein [Microbacterium ureisolvens]MBW9110380.1 fumarylacetoacetate hydrolase family protein [Microbacterium ureisolvens]